MGLDPVTLSFLLAAGAGAAGFAGGSLLADNNKPPAPIPAPNPQTAVTEGQVEAARKNKQRREAINQGGRPSTFKTGAAGLTGAVQTQKKELLGQ